MAFSDPRSPLRRRRLACGLTQAQLAAHASVSRQLIAAVESGQNTPAVDAAVRIARALDTTVEALFAPGRADAVRSALGGTLEPGVPLRAGRVGDGIVAAPLGDHGAAGTGWAAPDAVLGEDGVRVLPGAQLDGFVIAGCDPALGVAEAMLRGRGAASLVVFGAPTGTALRALERGTVHAAAVHGIRDRLAPPPVPVLRLQFAAWPVGLAVPAGAAAPSLESVLAGSRTVVQRDRAATSQQALDRAAAGLGVAVAPGPQADGHIEAARLGRILDAPAVTTEAAARAFGLRFLAVEHHTVELWVAAAWASHPGLEALGNLLRAGAFAARLGAFGGYELDGCGRYLSAG